MKYKNILVTGGLGFIGSNFLEFLVLQNVLQNIVCLDLETYAANLQIKTQLNEFITFVKGDICDKTLVSNLFKKYSFDLVINFAASSHVDRSLLSHSEFLQTNILGVENLLSNTNKIKNSLFVQISTDEVYGSLDETSKPNNETDMLKASSIYSASKAGGEQIVLAYHKSYQQKYLITRSTNNFGPYQNEEKFIPQIIKNILNGTKISIYGNGQNIRDWISVNTNIEAIWYLINNNVVNEIVNIGSQNQITNLQLVKKICMLLNVDYKSYIKFIPDRLGHDYKYGICTNKLKQLGYTPKQDFTQKLIETIEYYHKKG